MPALQILRHNEALIDLSPQVVVRDLVGGVNLKQGAEQPGVVEVKLGLLDHALAVVAMMRRQSESDIAGFENRKPRANGLVVHAQLLCDARHVQQLSRSPRTQSDEPLESAQIHDVGYASDIAFDVCLDVGRKVVPRR